MAGQWLWPGKVPHQAHEPQSLPHRTTSPLLGASVTSPQRLELCGPRDGSPRVGRLASSSAKGKTSQKRKPRTLVRQTDPSYLGSKATGGKCVREGFSPGWDRPFRNRFPDTFAWTRRNARALAMEDFSESLKQQAQAVAEIWNGSSRYSPALDFMVPRFRGRDVPGTNKSSNATMRFRHLHKELEW